MAEFNVNTKNELIACLLALDQRTGNKLHCQEGRKLYILSLFAIMTLERTRDNGPEYEPGRVGHQHHDHLADEGGRLEQLVQGRREHGPQAPVLVLPVHLPEVVSLQPQPGDVARPVPDAARPVNLHAVVLRGGNIIQLSTWPVQ